MTYYFQTIFGSVIGHKDDGVCEFRSKECLIVATNSDNDGPHWENNDFNWSDINDLCHRIFDRNVYGVASGLDETVIDSTDSYEEMDTWKAWTTDNTSRLHGAVKETLMHGIQYAVRKEIPSLNDESLGMADVVEWSKDIYSIMLETGDQFIDAFEAVAEQKGYEVA
jgi:hypothetical protein